MYDLEEIRAQWAKQRPGLNTNPMELIGRIIRLSDKLSQEMATTFAKHGLTGSGFDVLATLLRSGHPHALSPNQLLEAMMVSSGTMTNRIDQLVKEGMVSRVKNPNDKRSVLITLTEKGLQIVDAAVTDHVETQARLVSVLTQDESEALNATLKSYLSKIQAM